ncbi:putative glucan endo-1,3-beta-glucosidase A-like [Capsicum annuum]|nr:putative glucan endo-1,3-beta-glucosidase A-like [Capsicum annuum]
MTNDSQMQDVATTVGATSIASTSRANAPQPMAPAEKPEKFAGIDFKRWQFTSEDAPEVPEGTSDKEHFMIVEAWKHSDFLYRNYILSGLQDDLYNIYKDNKAAERSSKENSTINGAHIIEDDQNNSKKRKKVEQGRNQPKKKFKGKCFNRGKIGHKSTDCRAPKKDKKMDQANMVESNKKCDDLCAMFSECNLMGNPHE